MKHNILYIFIGLFLTACSENISSFLTTAAINETLQESPFAEESRNLTGILDLNDATIPNLKQTDSLEPQFISRCTKEVYEIEKQQAIEAAINDDTRKTIPVKYSISVGNKNDDTAFYAHYRSILRSDIGDTHPIYIGPKTSFIYRGANAKHLTVNHAQARKDFIEGKKCFFSTMQAEDLHVGEIKYNGRYVHNYAILRYGDKYTSNSTQLNDQLLSPRLFKTLDQFDYETEAPQILPLYIADLRDKTFSVDGKTTHLLNQDFSSSATRRREYTVNYREIFNLRTLWTHRKEVTKYFATARDVKSGSRTYSHSPYEAMPQLIDWIVFSGLDAVVTSTQYTPLVLDLGKKHITTSSTKWGTFFNLANTTIPGTNRLASHLTAWLGGNLEDAQDMENDVNDVAHERLADDGFLVLPNQEGDILGPKQLFGDFMEVDVEGETKTFDNGFAALVALAKKDCESELVKDQFVGPWDGELYSDTLKVWVDANRNGFAEKAEIKSLADAKVGAIGVCYFKHEQDKDRYGNTTQLRAPFVYYEDIDKLINQPNSLIDQIASGMDENGNKLEFRVVIDILFNVMTDFYLEADETGS